LIKDIEGEVTLAFKRKESFEWWGRHYLPSLMNAHHYQYCNNFKDPGIQKYGGELYKNIKDDAEEIFCSLPPSKSLKTMAEELQK